MLPNKREHPKEKAGLHPRNKHKERYNFTQLISCCPELRQFVKLNEYEDESIDFFNPEAVKMLNKALLMYYYDITFWDIPKNYLCPPIPGRADYIHHVADLLYGNLPVRTKNTGENNVIACLDIGVGANCVYPIIGNKEYGWSFVGTDIDDIALKSASNIIDQNPILAGKVQVRLQRNPKDMFRGIIQQGEIFDVSICNPPFHASFAEAQAGAIRKLTNLKHKTPTRPVLNFGGKSTELWCEGGEERFVGDMVHESKAFGLSVLWFSALISNQSSLNSIYYTLKQVGAEDVKTISMSQGNKMSRIVAWTFLTEAQQKKWMAARWAGRI